MLQNVPGLLPSYTPRARHRAVDQLPPTDPDFQDPKRQQSASSRPTAGHQPQGGKETAGPRSLGRSGHHCTHHHSEGHWLAARWVRAKAELFCPQVSQEPLQPGSCFSGGLSLRGAHDKNTPGFKQAGPTLASLHHNPHVCSGSRWWRCQATTTYT